MTPVAWWVKVGVCCCWMQWMMIGWIYWKLTDYKMIAWGFHEEPWESKGTPAMQPPPGNEALLRDYQPPSSPNKALLRPHVLRMGMVGGVPLNYHDRKRCKGTCVYVDICLGSFKVWSLNAALMCSTLGAVAGKSFQDKSKSCLRSSCFFFFEGHETLIAG